MYRTPENATADEQTVLRRQISMEFGDSNNVCERNVYSVCTSLDDSRKYREGPVRGTVESGPSLACSGRVQYALAELGSNKVKPE